MLFPIRAIDVLRIQERVLRVCWRGEGIVGAGVEPESNDEYPMSLLWYPEVGHIENAMLDHITAIRFLRPTCRPELEEKGALLGNAGSMVLPLLARSYLKMGIGELFDNILEVWSKILASEPLHVFEQKGAWTELPDRPKDLRKHVTTVSFARVFAPETKGLTEGAGG